MFDSFLLSQHNLLLGVLQMSLLERDIKKDRCNVIYVGPQKTKMYDNISATRGSKVNLSKGQPKQDKIKKI